MDALEEATAALRTAEQKLRSVLVQAAGAGDYDHLSRIAEWAKLLSAVVSGQPVAHPVPAPPEPPAVVTSDNDVYERAVARTKARAPAAGARKAKAKAGRRKKPRRSRTVKSEYPKFMREGDSLVKIGWSRREGKPYEHKAPRGVLRSLVQALVRVGSGGERFTVEGILPLREGGTDVPDYQTYLTLAWLRSVGLITQHGRQGYSLPNAEELERESQNQWDSLTAR